MLEDNLKNREFIVQHLREELYGPVVQGQELETFYFENENDSYKPYQRAGEEVLRRGSMPLWRYGVGVLFPQSYQSTKNELENDDIESGNVDDKALKEDNAEHKGIEELTKLAERVSLAEDSTENEPDIPQDKRNKASSMGLSFLAELQDSSQLIIQLPRQHPKYHTATNGVYYKQEITIAADASDNQDDVTENTRAKKPTLWCRKQLQAEDITIPAEDLYQDRDKTIQIKREFVLNNTLVKLEPTLGSTLKHTFAIHILRRRFEVKNRCLITVTLINRSQPSSSFSDEYALFQSFFSLTLNNGEILPYPQHYSSLDEEEQNMALLYRNEHHFAIGHGCAADWRDQESTASTDCPVNYPVDISAHVHTLYAETMPSYTAASFTADVKVDGEILKVSMKELAGLDNPNSLETGGNNPKILTGSLTKVVEAYANWLTKEEAKVSELEAQYQEAAQRHLEVARSMLERMHTGLELLESEQEEHKPIQEAFRLANYAMFLQQLRSTELRKESFNTEFKKYSYDKPYIEPQECLDNYQPSGTKGYWRAFQIAFLLASLESNSIPTSAERETVDLIWFPTGGGKTEAYLGLAAFSMFLRRLRCPEDVGVNVLMRYTLRLLTAQQFQRACRLICAMDYLRLTYAQPETLGKEPFSIGIWVGQSVTPNENKDACKLITKSRREESSLLITQCPWCGAEMGTAPENGGNKAGYVKSKKEVIFICPDKECSFSESTTGINTGSLPIYVVDEQIYDKRPSLIIGTVDKFAQLIWKPETRSLFGLDDEGNYKFSPPQLIIQDELHLISGPLGSMVGLFETLVEELCTNREPSRVLKPKIVCSTATIRNYKQQIRALFAREKAVLFPPPVLDIADSFFSSYAKDAYGKPKEGKIYLGVMANNYPSIQTAQIQTQAALLQAPKFLEPEHRNPWWTLLSFFNSLRDIGNTASLLQAEVRQAIYAICQRYTWEQAKDIKDFQRSYWSGVEELTSRLKNHEIPEALKKLEQNYNPQQEDTPQSKYVKDNPRAVDICLASNIIEVGVDVDRLALMTVVGQPKTTSQYIQVTGRVGRDINCPGLVVTIFSPTRSRDLSHYEKFRNYHQKLYAQVEPTSVTPFALPVLQRLLHGVIVGYVRLRGKKNIAPNEDVGSLLREIYNIIRARFQIVRGEEGDRRILDNLLEKRQSEWSKWQYSEWQSSFKANVAKDGLLYRGGDYLKTEQKEVSWSTPNSLRNVDATCQAELMQRIHLNKK